MHIGLSLILVVLFLAMNAFFVIAEFALVRVRKSQLELAVEQGKKGAKSAMYIAENVNQYLSACQLGITLASLAIGLVGRARVLRSHPPAVRDAALARGLDQRGGRGHRLSSS